MVIQFGLFQGAVMAILESARSRNGDGEMWLMYSSTTSLMKITMMMLRAV